MGQELRQDNRAAGLGLKIEHRPLDGADPLRPQRPHALARRRSR